MAFTGDFSVPLLLLLLLACETTESQSISGGPLSDSPKCVSGFCLQKGYQEPYNERALLPHLTTRASRARRDRRRRSMTVLCTACPNSTKDQE